MILKQKINLIATALLISGSLNAYALESDRNQPIAIEADAGSLDQKNQVTVFTGNVVIKQGSLNFRANAVRVAQDKQGNQHIQAEGNPVHFGQQLEDKGYVEGSGNQVEYESSTGLVRLTGNAMVKRGGDVARGAAITYNMRTEVYTVLGSKMAGTSSGTKNGRVSVIIQPNTVNKNNNKPSTSKKK